VIASPPPAKATETVRPHGAASDYGRAAFEAMVQSGSIVAKGLEGIGQAWFGLTQASLQDGAATARAILGARSAQQVLELQANYARATLDRLMVEGGKLSALSVAVANRAIEPIQSQVNAAAARLWRRAA
jgi:phasin family protein